MNRDYSVGFEIAQNYCISDSSVDYEGYFILSKVVLQPALPLQDLKLGSWMQALDSSLLGENPLISRFPLVIYSEQKDMHSSSPARIPKLQLYAKPPSTGECQNPPKKKRYESPRAKEKLQQDSRRGTTAFKIKPHTCHRLLEGTNKTLCAPGLRERSSNPHERLNQTCLCMSEALLSV